MINTSSKIKLILFFVLLSILFSSSVQANVFSCSSDNIDKFLEAENIKFKFIHSPVCWGLLQWLCAALFSHLSRLSWMSAGFLRGGGTQSILLRYQPTIRLQFMRTLIIKTVYFSDHDSLSLRILQHFDWVHRLSYTQPSLRWASLPRMR